MAGSYGVYLTNMLICSGSFVCFGAGKFRAENPGCKQFRQRMCVDVVWLLSLVCRSFGNYSFVVNRDTKSLDCPAVNS